MEAGRTSSIPPVRTSSWQLAQEEVKFDEIRLRVKEMYNIRADSAALEYMFTQFFYFIIAVLLAKKFVSFIISTLFEYQLRVV